MAEKIISEIVFVKTYNKQFYAVYAGDHLLLESTEKIDAETVLDALGFDVRSIRVANTYAQEMPNRLSSFSTDDVPQNEGEKPKMMEVREFKPAFIGRPTDDEIREGIRIANREGCIVRLGFTLQYYGKHDLDIAPGMTFAQCKRNLSTALEAVYVGGVK